MPTRRRWYGEALSCGAARSSGAAPSSGAREAATRPVTRCSGQQPSGDAMAPRWLPHVPWRRATSHDPAPVPAGRATPAWLDLPLPARLYVSSVIVAGGTMLAVFFPRQIPDPFLFTGLALFAWLTSAWKVTLPLPIVNGSTLSVSYAANLMALLLLGPSPSLVIAVAAFWIQCTYKPKQRYPLHRTLFSTATGVLTMLATSVVFTPLGGPDTPLDSFALARPLVGAIATYFTINTGLVACAIALSSKA